MGGQQAGTFVDMGCQRVSSDEAEDTAEANEDEEDHRDPARILVGGVLPGRRHTITIDGGRIWRHYGISRTQTFDHV
jgi:hypothetical protein